MSWMTRLLPIVLLSVTVLKLCMLQSRLRKPGPVIAHRHITLPQIRRSNWTTPQNEAAGGTMLISAWNINVQEGHSSRGLICQPGFQLHSNASPSSQAWSRQMNLHQSCSLKLLPFLSHSSYERGTNQGAPSPPPVAGTLFSGITGEMEPVSYHIANKEAYEIFMPYRGAFNRWSSRVTIRFEAIDVLRHGMCLVCYLVLGKWKTQLGEVETARAITFFISTIYQKCHMTPLCLSFR